MVVKKWSLNWVSTIVLTFLALVAHSNGLGDRNGFGVPEVARVWTVLTRILSLEDDLSVLQGLFPVVFQLDDSLILEDMEQLPETVSELLVKEFQKPNEAALLIEYCYLYPMGFPSELTDGEETNSNYFILNDKHYYEPDDVFYLKSGDLKKQSLKQDADILLVNDVVIGENSKAPIVLLYGCPVGDGVFDSFNRNLFAEAKAEKLRYIWRSTCSLDYQDDPIELSVSLTKRKNSGLTKWNYDFPGDLPAEFRKRKYTMQLPTTEELKDMDLKVASLIGSFYEKTKNFSKTLDYAKSIVNNYLLLVPQLLKAKVNERIIETQKLLSKKGIDYNMLGLYINGNNLRFSMLNEYTLLNAIKMELQDVNRFEKLLSNIGAKNTLPLAKKLLSRFSQFSLNNLKELQPFKLDLHRIPAFEGSVIYFNDIEKDTQYNELSTDVEAFFEKSKYGEIPEFRQNWNEIIFVIDFNTLHDSETQEALSGLIRALNIISQGYPQRIGLLPLHTGNDKNIIRSIYELKESGIKHLIEFLNALLKNENDEINDKDLLFSDYEDVPSIDKFLEDMEIYENSVIINGEIYPFKSNTWNYLIAKIIKKDVTLLKRELSRQKGQKDVKVRGLLHLKSGVNRNSRYLPDYFADSVYTYMNNGILENIRENLIEYIPNKEFNVLHTITLADDFNQLEALNRLESLINISYGGIKIRLINLFDDKSGNWGKLKDAFLKSKDLISVVESLQRKKPLKKGSEKSVGIDILHKWLPDVPLKYIDDRNFMIFNGKVISFEGDEILDTKLFESILQREAKRTLDTMYSFEEIYPDFFIDGVDPNNVEVASSLLTKMFYHSSDIYHNGIEYKTESELPRMDLNKFLENDDFTIFDKTSKPKPVDILLILDPLEERSQKILSLVSKIEQLPFINIKLVILPTKDLSFYSIERVYLPNTDIDDLLSSDLRKYFDIEIDSNPEMVMNENFEITDLVLEVHAFDETRPVSEGTVDGQGGVCLELLDSSDNLVGKAFTMETFGYGQFNIPKLGKCFKIQSCDPRFEVVSFSDAAYSDYISVKSFSILDFNPKKVYVKLRKLSDDKFVKTIEDNKINIFSTLNGSPEEEGNYKEMVLSILASSKNDGKRIKFWILDIPQLSTSFREFCSRITLEESVNSEIEFIKYNWPSWLRPQRFIDRRLDISKFIFIDVLFPQEVDKIVYMDPTREPIDIFDILEGSSKFSSPFVMFPISGKGYWSEGYWSKMLKEKKLRFHSIHPGFVINLQELRKLSGGDKLRIHYQRLSADVRSLTNIGQDLVNDVQADVSIAPLKKSLKKRLEISEEKLSALRQLISNGSANSKGSGEPLHDEL
ncbi:hypothetical protein Kpol_1040p6 [Vanderwaltozyma polyspora DSM 70294]|uniref:Killer toxin-resistance protein 5 n=1 Tax=Vanderwaltozyma polyspora (strain ATCC 22028 / DSM 70294 / BCRC 21397 / CBS 2163 / NBRC 10782 / NRRL Y-8283 / UCD 57-17) TaxID=436907 RepID=A7TPK1_VANPO|nr:uncharacterized protein Kpol_1040p6 [Vanderwaltozyma polyspora DSM 70294]EDO15793.1 hypothetical protein Kpol_1040p6 [Vanderwaltozyma polyspora DSM 70294]